MILEPGSKVLIDHRRLFDNDSGRYFLAAVDAYDSGIARVTGHTWVRDKSFGKFQRKREEVTKLISLSSGSLIVYALPDSVDLSTTGFRQDGADLRLYDARGFEMDLSESIPRAPAAEAVAEPPPSNLASV